LQKEESVEGALAQKRQDLVKQLIKGTLNVKEALIHPLAVLTQHDFELIERARQKKATADLKKQQIQERKNMI
jgi:hypothetical protein